LNTADFFAQRAAKSSPQKLKAILARVPDVSALDGDQT
jgi:hypothetical protein